MELYPRCKSLGLIEAKTLGPSMWVSGQSIRGVKASASLKLNHASRSGRVCALYPRCKSLGLIEAVAHKANHIRPVIVSEV